MPLSDTTILASLMKHARGRPEGSDAAVVRVAGVDDWAWRKGHKYGTIIVDLERRAVVDVLADCSAATMTNWFRDHPNVDVVSRDRAGLYAEAAREGAPQAKQVADRFHLMQNFRETVERQLGGYEAPIRDSRISGGGNQALLRPTARLSDNRSSTRSGLSLKEAIPSGKLPANLALAADGSKDGCVASTCRTITQWRQPLPLRRISAFYSSGGGPRASPKSATCSRRYAVAAILGPSVIWHVSLHLGGAERLLWMTTSRKH